MQLYIYATTADFSQLLTYYRNEIKSDKFCEKHPKAFVYCYCHNHFKCNNCKYDKCNCHDIFIDEIYEYNAKINPNICMFRYGYNNFMIGICYENNTTCRIKNDLPKSVLDIYDIDYHNYDNTVYNYNAHDEDHAGEVVLDIPIIYRIMRLINYTVKLSTKKQIRYHYSLEQIRELSDNFDLIKHIVPLKTSICLEPINIGYVQPTPYYLSYYKFQDQIHSLKLYDNRALLSSLINKSYNGIIELDQDQEDKIHLYTDLFNGNPNWVSMFSYLNGKLIGKKLLMSEGHNCYDWVTPTQHQKK